MVGSFMRLFLTKFRIWVSFSLEGAQREGKEEEKKADLSSKRYCLSSATSLQQMKR